MNRYSGERMSSKIVSCLLFTTLFTESAQQNQQRPSSPSPVDGGWTAWADSGGCSVTCGKGSIFRLRFCKNPAPQHGGKQCEGLPFERQECLNAPCPIDGGWSPWKQISACSATCGLAFRTSARVCDHPPPQYGGKPCEGNTTDTERCRELPLCAVHGQWGNWSEFSDCSVKCGNGTKTRTRSCDNPAPQYGGLECAGNKSETVVCSANDCPVDGGWSEWISTGDSCSRTCGRGSRIRIRTCNNPTPSNGGQKCPGDPYESTFCKLRECPVDGGWSLWTPYTTCSTTCGVGYQTSTRTCTNPSPQSGGLPCTGKSNDTRQCPHAPLCPIDGGWSSWRPNSACSATCGAAYRSLIRECNSPTPENGGKPCEGNGTATQSCSDSPPCPTTMLTTLSKENPSPTPVHVTTKTTEIPSTKTTEGTSTLVTEGSPTIPTEGSPTIPTEGPSSVPTEGTSSLPTEGTSAITTEMLSQTTPIDLTTVFSTSIPSITITSTRSPPVTSREGTVKPESTSSTLQLQTSRLTSSTTTSSTPTSPGDVTKPKLGLVSVSFVIYIDKSFDDKLLDQTSTVYQETQKMVLEVLIERFKDTPGFVNVVLNGFSYGSIRVNYSVSLSGEAISSVDKVSSVKDYLMKKATQWTPKEPVFSGFPVNVIKTNRDTKTLNISTLLVNERNAACSCPQNDYRCDFNYGNTRCVHLCSDVQCGKHGSCVVDAETKTPKCLCRQSEKSKLIYVGVNCEKTNEVNDEKIPDDKPDKLLLIGLVAGMGGGLFLFIIIALVCICRKIQEQQTQRERSLSYSNRSSLCLDHLDHNKLSKQNFYTNSTHNPVYQDTDDVQIRPKSEQVLRIFVHVDPDERKSMSLRSVTSFHSNEEQMGTRRSTLKNIRSSEVPSDIPDGNEAA